MDKNDARTETGPGEGALGEEKGWRLRRFSILRDGELKELPEG